MCQASKNFGIMYLDFDSLYPSVNYEGRYMLGHPVAESYYADVEWSKPEDMVCPHTGKAFAGGFYQVRVLAPKGLFLHVIPVRMDNR